MKIDFSNTENAFRLHSSTELKKAHFLFSVLAYPSVVKTMKKLVAFSFKIGLPVRWIIKKTAFFHFCGGETIEECTTAVAGLYSQNVLSVLDYSVEGKAQEADFERTKNMTLETIRYASHNPGVPFAVFKPSGIGSNDLYEKVGSGENLSELEEKEWANVRQRYYDIAQLAFDNDIPVMVDAEEVRIQEAVDQLVAELMAKYNTEKAIVFNTAQLYRVDRLEHIKKEVEDARKGGYFYGVKIVRGAYMERERRLAKAKGYSDPIQPNKPASDNDYNAATRFLIENHDICSVMVATHNEESTQQVADLMEEFGLKPDDERVYVAQLYGMSDNLSFNMAAAGYKVAKYLPFGPVKDVMPYLFRRAEENTSVKGQTGRELAMIKTELKRRKSA